MGVWQRRVLRGSWGQAGTHLWTGEDWPRQLRGLCPLRRQLGEADEYVEADPVAVGTRRHPVTWTASPRTWASSAGRCWPRRSTTPRLLLAGCSGRRASPDRRAERCRPLRASRPADPRRNRPGPRLHQRRAHRSRLCPRPLLPRLREKQPGPVHATWSASSAWIRRPTHRNGVRERLAAAAPGSGRHAERRLLARRSPSGNHVP
jgi:hypothetical protein